MQFDGTMMMDTNWPFIDWINDVWPIPASATPDAIVAVALLTFVAVWWGFWNDRV